MKGTKLSLLCCLQCVLQVFFMCPFLQSQGMTEEKRGEISKKEQKRKNVHSPTDLLEFVSMKKFNVSPYWWKQKMTRAIWICFSSSGSMEYLGKQKVTNVASHYIWLYQIPTEKYETPMRVLHTSSKTQLLPFCYIKKKSQRPY